MQITSGPTQVLAGAAPDPIADTTLWRIGLKNNSASEFTGSSFPSSFQMPPDWRTRELWPEFPPHSSGEPSADSAKFDTAIHYVLAPPASKGALLRVKTVNASEFVTELAIFSNGFPCGILQTIGTENGPDGLVFGNTYQLYIPPEFLHAGDNVLRIEKLGHPYNRASLLGLSITLDWVELLQLNSPVTEPIHSRYVRIGTNWGLFPVNDLTLVSSPLTWLWTGTAYTNSPARICFWCDLPDGVIARPREYLAAAKDYNMTVVLNYSNCTPSARSKAPDWIDDKGQLVDYWRKKLDQTISAYGSSVQYYEICNEPCMYFTDAPLAVTVAVGKYLQTIKPPTLKIAAPAFAYAGGMGDPKDWDLDSSSRKAVEAVCDTANGHGYGSGYASFRGSFNASIRDYGDKGILTNGFPREFINTEMGVMVKPDVDERILRVSQPNASILDRNHRAHAGFCDVYMHFSMFGPNEYRNIQGDPAKPETWVSTPFPMIGPNHDVPQDSPIRVLRRMTLAYGTHGRPLPYQYADLTQVRDRLVYFRAVDTSTLPPLPGSGATADKILVSFVNFTRENQVLRVNVTFPQARKYTGLRFGPEDRYTDARSDFSLTAAPTAAVSESLGPGESVEYILH